MLYCECQCFCCDTQVFLLPDGSTGEGIVCYQCGRQLRAAFLWPFGEAEWLAHDSPAFLASFDKVRSAADRKRRLFACHCCRLIWDRLTDARSRTAVEVAEHFTEGAASGAEVTAAEGGALATAESAAQAVAEGISPQARATAAWAAVEASVPDPVPADVVRYVVPGRRVDPKRYAELARRVVALLRCIFGNPFRPGTLAPDLLRWRDGLLVAAARRMYDARDFSDMPVLADMLQDAGCDDEQVLTHCRQGGEHVRGCFLIDHLLGHG
jgi:hypothetical protein